ncbi:unnamed protein product [Sphenostylis stenocarpa]|uniref:Uncharacterized protein n=1 Tax=Sphenostylis stenocarpa TaxID=92480 RepID=A0AA86V8M2_9FABA|nr:unnamed protein product [Sphenostylis stenocarpa]
MKAEKGWRLGSMGDMQILPGSRHRPPLKKPMWIIILVLFVCVFLICAYIYPPKSSSACYVFSSRGCKSFVDWLPPMPAREYTDEEIASRVVIKDILNSPAIISRKSKVAFMFLSPGSLPFEKLWDKFFQKRKLLIAALLAGTGALHENYQWSRLLLGNDEQSEGHEGKFSVYVHASKTKPVHVSRYFVNRDVRSDQVIWGKISMVDAERRLLANALQDPDNQQFVLLSDSCVPLYHFDYIYNYLMYTNISFVDCFKDPGPHGNGRYSDRMLPEVEVKDFRKGAQWFAMKRQHAIIVMADSLYYSKFRSYCQVWMPQKILKEWQCGMLKSVSNFDIFGLILYAGVAFVIKPGLEGRNCIADEHYLPTFFQMVDPGGIANWSLTHVDWSERKWHPKSYRAQDVTSELLKNITVYPSIEKCKAGLAYGTGFRSHVTYLLGTLLRLDRLPATYIECKVNWPWSSVAEHEQKRRLTIQCSFLWDLGWMDGLFFSFHFRYTFVIDFGGIVSTHYGCSSL